MRRLFAILLGFFSGFLIPYVLVAALFSTLSILKTDGSEEMPRWFNAIPFLVFAIMPIVAGFVTARIAKVQPMLNGLLVGALGAILAIVVSPLHVSMVMSAIFSVVGGVAGGWLQRRTTGRGNVA